MEEPSLSFLGGISNWPHVWRSWWNSTNTDPHPLKIKKISPALPTEIEQSVLKIDLSPLNWIKDPKTHQDVCRITKRVAGLKNKMYGLPTTISSKEDLRDILVSLGWPVRLDLPAHEIVDIKNFVSNSNSDLKVVDVCLVPHKNGHRHFVCIRIRGSVVQGDCTNTPLHLIKHSEKGKNSRSVTQRVLKTAQKKIPVQKTKNSIKKKKTHLSLKHKARKGEI